MCELSPVNFYGDTIFCIEYQGEPYVPMRPIVENMGMDWARQSTKLNANKTRWTVAMMPTVAQDGKQREMLCLPLRKLAAWLASINPKKVRQELRAKIELYQAESDDALWNYWMNGRAEHKIPSGASLPAKDKYESYMEEVEAFRARAVAEIEILLRKGLGLVNVYKFGPGGIEGFTTILLDWLQSVAGQHAPLIGSRGNQ